MIQETIALLIVAIAVYLTLKSLITFFKNTKKGKICSCSSCPSKSILKEIKKQQVTKPLANYN